MQELKKKGLSTVEACEAAGISRSGYYARLEAPEGKQQEMNLEDAMLLEKINELKKNYPFFGYRRTWAWLRRRLGIKVNKKRVHRLMKEHGLLVERRECKAKRTPQRSKPRPSRPNEIWGIDMTKFMVDGVGWVYLIIVLDWFLKKIVGWNVTLRCRAAEWKAAMDMAVNNQFPDGVKGKGLKLVSDNGSQPTSDSFMKEMDMLGIEQIFTSYNNPKGNADTERVIRTLKENCIWLSDFEGADESRRVIGEHIEKFYNKEYVHSALGYLSPEEFEKAYYAALKEEAA